MRLPKAAHTSRPWLVHALTEDFRLEDVWALPVQGGPDDFPGLVRLVASGDWSRSPSPVARTLWTVRRLLGQLLRWDRPEAGLGSRVSTLRDRMPAEFRTAPAGPDVPPFRSLYILADEWAAELANRTVHGVVHLGWVPDGVGFRGQMAILVRPNGFLGRAYMATIRPFRHLIVYPEMMRGMDRAWHSRSPIRLHAARTRCERGGRSER